MNAGMYSSTGRRLVLQIIVVLCLLGAGRSVQAERVNFYNSGGTFTDAAMGIGEPRWTHFQALNNVTLPELGVFLDPPSPNSFQWALYNADNTASSFTDGTFDDVPFFSTTTSFIDSGLQVYNTPVNVSLTANNYYILELTNRSSANATLRLYHEVNQGLPFTTSDGNFSILNGGVFRRDDTLLAAFSVPEPSSLVLLGIGLIGLACGALGCRRQKRDSRNTPDPIRH